MSPEKTDGRGAQFPWVGYSEVSDLGSQDYSAGGSAAVSPL